MPPVFYWLFGLGVLALLIYALRGGNPIIIAGVTAAVGIGIVVIIVLVLFYASSLIP
jgi:hypothetical protein